MSGSSAGKIGIIDAESGDPLGSVEKMIGPAQGAVFTFFKPSGPSIRRTIMVVVRFSCESLPRRGSCAG